MAKNRLEIILAKDAIEINKKINLKEISNKQIIITGASGLIGINFIASIKEFCGNTKMKLPKITAVFHGEIQDHFKKILSSKNFNIKRGDITDFTFSNSLPKADFIIHAAGYGQPGRFMQDQIKTFEINTKGTLVLLQKLKPGGKFLFVSSSEVYSGLLKPPYKETEIGTTNTTHPRACYIEGKRGGETICNIYREKGVQVKSARLSLAYGPGTRKNDMRVLNSFIEKGLNGDINMLDQGQAQRTYCYVRDAIEIMWQILLNGKDPIYNVGGFSSTTIFELAKKIADNLKVKLIIPKKENKLQGAPNNVQLDMSKVAKEFGKKRKDFVSLDQGLKNTITWYEELYRV